MLLMFNFLDGIEHSYDLDQPPPSSLITMDDDGVLQKDAAATEI